jgi:hypothetical protein
VIIIPKPHVLVTTSFYKGSSESRVMAAWNYISSTEMLVSSEDWAVLLTYFQSWALLEEPLIVQPLKNFPACNGSRRFYTVFTRTLHWSLSWAIWIQPTPCHPVSLSSIFILFTHLRFGLPVVSFLLALLPVSYVHSSSPPFVLHVPPISLFFTWSLQLYLEKNTSYEAPLYAVL